MKFSPGKKLDHFPPGNNRKTAEMKKFDYDRRFLFCPVLRKPYGSEASQNTKNQSKILKLVETKITIEMSTALGYMKSN